MSDEETVPASFRPGIQIREVHVRVGSTPRAPKTSEAVGETVTVGSASDNTLVLADEMVSRYHLEIRCAGDRLVVRDVGSTNGTTIGPVTLRDAEVTVEPGTSVRIGSSVLAIEPGSIAQLDSASVKLGALLARSPAMRRVIDAARKAAARDVSVLIHGESGTGKELLARAIHESSTRRSAPFIVVDCGAIPAPLVGSELFGHERGAFTSADKQHLGAFERADRGTIFLDEIGELPLEIQPALLGVLERRSLRRLGGRDDIRSDFRVIAATHRDLRAAVNAGTVRLDLYYRLAAVTLTLPPLRERPDEIPMLVEHFLCEEGYDGPIETIFDAEAVRRLQCRSWPGNARELKNHVAATLSIGMEPAPLPGSDESGDAIGRALELSYRDARRVVTEDFESRYLRALLERAGGSVRKAARMARMDRSYLSELLKRHSLGGSA
jgi:DNA-binding NtrC family response regulator